MSTSGLSPVAAFVLRSLRDHPELRWPEAIAAGPASDGTSNVQSVKDGLRELEAQGLAQEESGRGWRLTEPALRG